MTLYIRSPENCHSVVQGATIKVPFYISGYRIAGGLLRHPRITTIQRYLDEPHSLVKIIDGIGLKA